MTTASRLLRVRAAAVVPATLPNRASSIAWKRLP
jgi:hypothetical protein